MSAQRIDTQSHRQCDEKPPQSVEDEQLLKITSEDRRDLDEASVIKYESGLAYRTTNRAVFQQVKAVCESPLMQKESDSDSQKAKAAKQTGQPASEPSDMVKKLSDLLSTHARLMTKFDDALDRLETLAGSKHRGYAGMRAWSYHFDAVAELADALAKAERGILDDKEIKAFVAGEK